MNREIKGWQIFVYDDVSKQWYGNETFKKGQEQTLAMACYHYGTTKVEISVREIT